MAKRAHTEVGAGAPVVLLHGVPDDGTEWDEVIEELAPRFRCFAPDLPGLGRSGAGLAGHDASIEAQGRWLAAWLDELGIEGPVTLVAHDVGAIAAAAFAAQAPARVAHLMLLNTVLWPGHRWRGAPKVWGHPLLGRAFMTILTPWLFRAGFSRDFPELSRESVARIAERFSPARKEGLLALFAVMTRPDYFTPWQQRFAALHRLVDLHVLWGARDPLIPVEQAHALGGQVEIVADAGHWLPLERPALVADRVRRLHGGTADLP